MGLVAYSCGLSGRRRASPNLTFAFLIALVLIIIIDIDRPRAGFVRVSQESLIRLQQSLGPATAMTKRAADGGARDLLAGRDHARPHAAGFTILNCARIRRRAPMPRAACVKRWTFRRSNYRPTGDAAVFELRLDPAAGRRGLLDRAQRPALRGDRRRCARPDLRCAGLREQLLDGTALDELAATTAAARAGLPRHQVQHALGQLSAELGARSALRHGARPRTSGRRFLDMMVENRFNAISLWTMHPFTYMIRPKNFPEASKWTRRAVRRVAAPVPRDLPHGEGTRPRHLRGVLEHLRQRGVREGARRRHAEFLSALLRERRHLATSRSATCARASRRCWRNIRTSTASGCRTAKAWAA